MNVWTQQKHDLYGVYKKQLKQTEAYLRVYAKWKRHVIFILAELAHQVCRNCWLT